MRKLPILFSGPMLRAILEGRKTQTRRILDPQPKFDPGGAIRDGAGGQMDYVEPHWIVEPRPRYAVGDLLWMREPHYMTDNGEESYAVYAAERDDVAMHLAEVERMKHNAALERVWKSHARLCPSIHMPRWASRITLRVTGVKVERLQDISEADAKAEGIEPSQRLAGAWNAYSDNPKPLTGAAWCVLAHGLGKVCLDGRHSFATLWESINGPGSWEANPWVAAYTFEPIFQNIDKVVA